MSFDNIIGNNKIKNMLEASVSSKHFSHSYMFIGEDGIGKFLFAKEFAKMILCEDFKNGSPCETCKSCIEYNTQNHPDFFIVSPEDEKSIKIEQIRYMQEKISEKPIVSSKKVYIINDSNLMTKEAQNCLLKTLEEPPEYAVIILVLSNESKILNTIKSRCTKIHFSNLTDSEIKEYFNYTNQTFNSNILKICNGSIGKAILLKDDVLVYEDLDKLIESFKTKDIVDIWNQSEILYKSKDSIYNLLEYMNVSFMNQVLEKNNLKFINCIKIIENTKNRLLANANYDMSIDNLCLGIWEEFHEKYNRS